MKGKVNYSGHALHGKTVSIIGEELAGHPSMALIPAYQIEMPEGHVILLSKDKVRVLAEVS